jgi:hypothetical protein
MAKSFEPGRSGALLPPSESAEHNGENLKIAHRSSERWEHGAPSADHAPARWLRHTHPQCWLILVCRSPEQKGRDDRSNLIGFHQWAVMV